VYALNEKTMDGTKNMEFGKEIRVYGTCKSQTRRKGKI
jgi:hypothetical protein